ncbi:hypothetical protein NKJ94_25790 [Mesorhizobium sp. M0060]
MVAGDSLTCGSHAGQAEIRGIGKDGGQQCALVGTVFAGAQIGERRHEACFAGDFVQKFGDANAWHHGRAPVGERFGIGGTVVLAGEICKRSSTRRTPSSLFRRAADASQGTGCRIRQGNVAVLGGVSSAFMLLAWAPFRCGKSRVAC